MKDLTEFKAQVVRARVEGLLAIRKVILLDKLMVEKVRVPEGYTKESALEELGTVLSIVDNELLERAKGHK